MKKLKYAAAGLVLLGLLTACEFLMGPGETSAGNVTIYLDGGTARSVITDGVKSALRYEVEFRGSGETFSRTVAAESETKAVTLPLAPGEWTITAQAWAGTILAGEGKETVKVVPNISSITITMRDAPSVSARTITAFSVTSPVTASGIINEGAKTIAITVPLGTAVNSMTVAVSHTGASVSPASGATVD
ncbi:MAG: hypothetical protein LBJ24_06780, partial [Treponema sp.]|nr:hypothetical protein [Treponema sp.]